MENASIVPKTDSTALAQFGGAPAIIDREGDLHRVDNWASMRGYVETDNIHAMDYNLQYEIDYYSSYTQTLGAKIDGWAGKPDNDAIRQLRAYTRRAELWVESELERASEFDPEVRQMFAVVTDTGTNIIVDHESPQFAVIDSVISPKWDIKINENLDQRYRQITNWVEASLEFRKRVRKDRAWAIKLRRKLNKENRLERNKKGKLVINPSRLKRLAAKLLGVKINDKQDE